MSEERRTLQRYSVNDQIALEMLDGERLRTQALLKNYSAKGLCIFLDQAVPVGSPVSLRTGQVLMLGEVVWCQPTGEGYEAGIELEHLLDTNELQVLIAGMSS